MRRSLEIRVLLFCATCLSGGGLAAAELQKLPVAGETFSGRIELLLEHPLVPSIDAGYVGHTR